MPQGGNIAHNDNPFCGGLMLFLFGIMLLYGGVQKYLLLQKIKNTPTSKVRSVAVGLVELFGKALCKTEMYSPISKQKCVYWKVEAHYYRSGKHGGWKPITSAFSGNPFYLEDDTGRMLISPMGPRITDKAEVGKITVYKGDIASVEIPVDVEFTGYISGKGMFGMEHPKLPQPALDFIGKQDEKVRNAFMGHQNENVRIREYFIAEGDPLYVLGTAQPIEGANSSVQHENLLIGPGKHEKVFYISDSHEKKITDSIAGGMPWMILGGLGGSALGLLLMLGGLGI